MMHGWGWNTGMGNWWFAGGIIPLVLIAALVIGGLVLYRRQRGDQEEDESLGHDLTPLEALKRRYARGEISRDEYLRIKSDLESER